MRVFDIDQRTWTALIAAHRMFMDEHRMGRVELGILIDRCHERLGRPDLSDIAALAALSGLSAAEAAIRDRNDRN